eukprot:950115-Amphidinium_carterae.3
MGSCNVEPMSPQHIGTLAIPRTTTVSKRSLLPPHFAQGEQSPGVLQHWACQVALSIRSKNGAWQQAIALGTPTCLCLLYSKLMVSTTALRPSQE